jgi:hypothetical protein
MFSFVAQPGSVRREGKHCMTTIKGCKLNVDDPIHSGGYRHLHPPRLRAPVSAGTRSVASALTLAGTTRDSLYEMAFSGLYGGSCRGNGASAR